MVAKHNIEAVVMHGPLSETRVDQWRKWDFVCLTCREFLLIVEMHTDKSTIVYYRHFPKKGGY